MYVAEPSLTSKILSLNLAPYPKQKIKDSKRRPYLLQWLACCWHGETAEVCWTPQTGASSRVSMCCGEAWLNSKFRLSYGIPSTFYLPTFFLEQLKTG